MKAIVFKEASKVRTYKVIAKKDFHIYKKGELIKTVATDIISKLNSSFDESEIEVIEVK